MAWLRYGLLILLCVASPAIAQPASTPDAARIEAATKLLDVLMPPARRDPMIAGMMAALRSNMAQSMRASPGLAEMFDKDPRVQPIFDRFVARQQAEVSALIRDNLPDMMTAMAHAYARRFTVQQMDEVARFFATPTGTLYMDQGATIMSDPDVGAWQRKMMSAQMTKMPQQIRTLTAEILALPPKAETP